MGKNRDWVFQQLTGSDPKSMVLTGYAAPFGRPRSKPVAETGLELREKQTRYPGSSSKTPPTTHTFGVVRRPIELSGRWMDQHLGEGSAARNVRVFEQMIIDQRPIRISWGDLLSYTGWIKSITPRWESLEECAWTMVFLIDTDEFEGVIPNVQPLRAPAETADDVQKFLQEVIFPLPKMLPSLDAITGEIFDALDDLVSNVTQFGGLAVRTANSISNIETAAFNEIERLRAGLHQFKTAVLTLQETIDNLAIDSLVVDRSVEDDIAWLTFQSQSHARTADIVNKVSLADIAAEVAAVSRIKTTYQAKPGDSWESISLAMYGTADRASDIRDANGVVGGEKPAPGRIYNIPR